MNTNGHEVKLEGSLVISEEVMRLANGIFNAVMGPVSARDALDYIARVIQTERERAEKAEKLVASYDRQDEAAGADAEAVDSVTELIVLLRTRAEKADAEVKAVLEQIPGAVNVCEGGAEANIYASLAVSVARLRIRAEKFENVLSALGLQWKV